MIAPLVLLFLFVFMGYADSASSATATSGARSPAGFREAAVADPASALYNNAGLSGMITREVFAAAHASVVSRGLDADSGTLAIADMSQPSSARRMVLVDLASQKVLLHTYVAHGQGSGGLMAEAFSNTHESHQTSLGLYRVGDVIRSPKHGPALLLHGLDAGVNDQARAREIIIHGADYVSERFIAQTGRLGRSWGCPAVPRADMAVVSAALANGGLLFVYGV